MHDFGQKTISPNFDNLLEKTPKEIVEETQDLAFRLFHKLKLAMHLSGIALVIFLVLGISSWFFPQILRSISGIALGGVLLFLLIVFWISYKKNKEDTYKLRLNLSQLQLLLKSQPSQTCGSMNHQETRAKS